MLKRFDTMTEKQRAKFEEINQANTLTASAWRMRENFLRLYESKTEAEFEALFNNWYADVEKSKIKPVLKAAKSIKEHLGGIVSQIGNNISNGRAEQTNSKIAKLQRMAQGYSNLQNLRAAILFFNGKLDLFSHD